MKNNAIVIGLFILAYSALAMDGIQVNTLLYNNSVPNYNCSAYMNNTAAANVTTIFWVGNSRNGTIYTQTRQCNINSSHNFIYQASALNYTCPPTTIYCSIEVSHCLMEGNGTSSLSILNVTASNCSTTSTTSSTTTSLATTTSSIPVSLTTITQGGTGNLLPDKNGSVSPLYNTTGLGGGSDRILGLSRVNFFYLVSLITTTTILLSLSKKNIRLALIAGIFAADYFSLVLGWLPITTTLLIFIHIIAGLFFLMGRNR